MSVWLATTVAAAGVVLALFGDRLLPVYRQRAVVAGAVLAGLGGVLVSLVVVRLLLAYAVGVALPAWLPWLVLLSPAVAAAGHALLRARSTRGTRPAPSARPTQPA